MKIKASPRLIRFTAVLAPLLLVISMYSQLVPWEQINLIFSTDTLYLPSIYQDVFEEGGSLQGWHLNGAPNFFPDMLVYFLLMAVCHHFVLATFLFSLLQVFAIIMLFNGIFRRVAPEAPLHYLLFPSGAICVILLEFFFMSKDTGFVFFLISNSFHTGAFVMAATGLYLSMRYLQENKQLLLFLLFIICILGAVSDRLFIVLFSGPLLFCLPFWAGKKKQALILAATVTAGTVAGYLLFRKLEMGDFFHINRPHALLEYSRTGESWNIFSEQMLAYLKEPGFRALTLYMFIISFAAVTLIIIRLRKQRSSPVFFFCLFSVVFSICTFTAPILNGNYTGADTIRYNIYPFYVSGLNLAVFLYAQRLRYQQLRTGGWLLGTGSVIIIVTALLHFSPAGLNAYFNYYPAESRLLDSLAEKHEFHRGVANYWVAKKISMFSKKNIKVHAVFDDLAAYPHVTNHNWHFGGHVFNFVVLNNFSDTSIYKHVVRQHEQVLFDERLQVAKTNNFTYQAFRGAVLVNIDE